MARTRSRKRGRRTVDSLLEKGVVACVLGAGMLAAPWFAGKSPILATMAQAVRPAGALALAIGAAMLVVRGFIRQRQKAPPLQPAYQQPRQRPPNAAMTDPVPAPNPPGQPMAPATSPSMPAASAPSEALAPITALPGISTTAGPFPATGWSDKVFAAIEWRRFEAVCEALFAQAGFQTRSQSHGADGGVDIWLHSRNSTGPVSVVQCKHWQGKPVGVKEMREFFGVMASHQLTRGTYATTSTYTADAQQFAKANGIHTLDGAGLLALIAKRTPEQQQTLLNVAFEGEYARPTCASCGTKMVERIASKDSRPFWGCANYPRCRRTLPMSMPRRLQQAPLHS